MALDVGRSIELHDRGQEDGIAESVGDVELAAERIAQGVDSSGVDGTEAESAIERTESQGLARLDVGGVVAEVGGFVVASQCDGPLQVGSDESDALQGVDVDRRMRELVGVCLDAMRQCVHARVRRHLGGYGPRQLGVNVCHVGDEERRDDALLQMVALVQEDGVGRHLAARACCGGQTGEPQALPTDEARAEAVFHLLVAVDESSHEFRHVEHASAADAYHAVGAELSGHLENPLEVVDGRLRHDVLKHLNGDAGGLQLVQRAFDERADGRCREHEEALQAHLLVIVCECLDAARAEHDFLRLQ